MSTVRLQIIDALAGKVRTATELPLFRNLDFALDADSLPALVVISGGDAPDVDLSPLGVLDQTCDVEIDVLVAGSSNPEADADPYEAAIHAALMASSDFGGYSAEVARLGGQWSFDLGDCAARRLAYRLRYRSSHLSLEA